MSATCFHVELEQFSACFRVARVCQRQLGFLVIVSVCQSVCLSVCLSLNCRYAVRTPCVANKLHLYFFYCYSYYYSRQLRKRMQSAVEMFCETSEM